MTNVLSNEAIVDLCGEMVVYGGQPHLVVRQIQEFSVQDDEADLFAAVARHAWEKDDEVTIHTWDFAKAVELHAFLTLGSVFELTLNSVVHDMYRLLSAGMNPEEIIQHEFYSDGSGKGILTVEDILAFRAAGVPGSYYSEICTGLGWQYHPMANDAMTYFDAGIPADYVRALADVITPAEHICQFWEDGVPVEFAVAARG